MNTEQKMTPKQWKALYKEAGQRVDPATAKTTRMYVNTFDPYGLHNFGPEFVQVGQEEFAYEPVSDLWVWFGDLSEEVRTQLWERLKRGLNFREATAELLSGITQFDLANAMGTSIDTVWRARVREGANVHRLAPEGWEGVVSSLARRRASELEQLANTLDEQRLNNERRR